jgi:hypothetical protein
VEAALVMKLTWQPWPRPQGYWLRVQMKHDTGAITPTGLREEHLIPVQQWSEKFHCGRRMSFDLWQFDTEEERSMFLLRWS